jgi:hypothetical protein
MGYVTEPFSEYLMNKDNKYDKYLHQYIQNSLYYKHVNNYLEYFDRNQLFILQLEKINDDFDRLCKFLDIEKLELKSDNEMINANKIPTNIISRTLQHNRYLATILKKIIPRKIVRSFNFLLYKKAEKVQLKESEKLLLEKYLNDDFLKLKKEIL